jgi:hypothetical protein
LIRLGWVIVSEIPFTVSAMIWSITENALPIGRFGT